MIAVSLGHLKTTEVTLGFSGLVVVLADLRSVMVMCVRPSTEKTRDKYNSYVLQTCIYFLFILILQNISYSYGNRETSRERERKGQ